MPFCWMANGRGELQYISLRMENERDEIHVDGDFVTATTRDHTNDLTNGLMYIGGDFWSDGNADFFDASGNHKVVLTGKEKQTVTFSSTSSHFAALQLTKSISNYLHT